MKRKFLFIILIQSFYFYSQNINLQSLEQELETEIPNEYLTFRGEELQNDINISFNNDNWLFWNIQTCVEKTLYLRKSNQINEKDFAFAIDDENTILFYQNSTKTSTKISFFGEDKDLILYVFSLTEFQNFKKTLHLIEELETVNFEKQNLSEIIDCPGSLFRYATELMTNEYDDDFSEKRNNKAIELFFIAAEKGHPDRANALKIQ